MKFMKKKTKIGKKTKMIKFDVFVEIEDERWKDVFSDLKKTIDACKDAVISAVQNDVLFLRKAKNFSVNLALSDDRTIWALNKEFRGMDKPTNVLSFANIDDEFFENTLQNEKDVELGDVMIAYETMAHEAKMLDISLFDHFCHLWVHALLHILGFDHIEEDERLLMEAKEIEILAALQIENPYQE